MQINEMSATDCRELLERASVGRLACSSNDQPYIVAVYLAYESDHLYGFSTVGQKIEWMRANPKICVQFDEIKDDFQWRSVVVRGAYRELPDLPPCADERSRARDLLARRALWWQTGFAARRAKSETDLIPPLFYCIDIDSITGYRATADAFEPVTVSSTERPPSFA
jgi:uncharacterized protein